MRLREGDVGARPRGEGPFDAELGKPEIACTPRGGEGVGEVFDPGMRCFEGEPLFLLPPPELRRRPVVVDCGLGVGDPNTSSFSTSTGPPDLGLC